MSEQEIPPGEFQDDGPGLSAGCGCFAMLFMLCTVVLIGLGLARVFR